MMNLAMLQGVVGGQNRAAGISENMLYAFALKAFPDDLCSGFHGQLPICFMMRLRPQNRKGPSSAADDGPFRNSIAGYLIR
jgi:hypothetical protein